VIPGGVWLTEKDISKDVYLSQSMTKRHIRSASGIVKKGAIVIVDFGHIYQALHFQNGLSDSSLYPCYHQTGEMHKRRPAIVISADARGVKIVPVTSKVPAAHVYNRAIFELEEESTRHITEFTPGKRSFVLCEMIQTVSPTKILPPQAKDNKGRERQFRRDESYYRRISHHDMQALEEGLLTAIEMSSLRKKNDGLSRERDQARETIKEQTAEIELLRATEQQLSTELAKLKKKYRILSDLHLPVSEHTSPEELQKEVSEYSRLG